MGLILSQGKQNTDCSICKVWPISHLDEFHESPNLRDGEWSGKSHGWWGAGDMGSETTQSLVHCADSLATHLISSRLKSLICKKWDLD